MDTLYKLSNGKILQWSANVVDNISSASIVIKHGEMNGKLQDDVRHGIVGKNKNKKNETSILVQASNEIESLYQDKRKRGYKSLKDLEILTFSVDDSITYLEQLLKSKLSEDLTTLQGYIKPMKCQQYYRSKPNWISPEGIEYKDRKYYYLKNPNVEKEPKSIIIDFPAIIQPKINGVRCTPQVVGNELKLLSKEGLEYKIPHITNALNVILPILIENNYILDGELYIPGEALQNITSAVKKENLYTSLIEFHVFDLAIPNMINKDRLELLKNLLFEVNDICIKLVPSIQVTNDATVQLLTDTFIKEGYEGSIIRNPKGLYNFGGRPKNIVKLKRLIDEEFEIIGIVSQSVDASLGMFACKTKDGKEFTANPTMSENDKRALFIIPEEYIGKMLTCSFYEYTEDGKPFHIVDTVIRDYE